MPPRSEPDLAAPAPNGWTDTEITVRLRRGDGGTTRVEGALCRAPVWFRWDGSTLWMVGSGASPVGDDHIRVSIDVGPDVAIAVRSVAATVVYAARGGTRWDTEIRVADGARLDWRPEPVIVTERARHSMTTTVHAAGTADVAIDEMLVLGRTGETPGLLRSTLDVRVDGTPVLLTSFDSSTPGWAGPAGVDGAAAVGQRLRIGPGGDDGRHGQDAPAVTRRDATLLRPAPGCRLAVATGAHAAAAMRSLDVVLPA